MLLTTRANARLGGKEPEFNSLSYHGKVSDDEWAVKIFSKERISDEWLSKTFLGQVGWVHRKEVNIFPSREWYDPEHHFQWDAYPVAPPKVEFPPVKLDNGFYYVNAFEPCVLSPVC